MPDLESMGRGGARRRTRRRMTAVNDTQNSQQEPQNEAMPPETEAMPESSDKLQKLAKLLVDKGVITESEFDLLFV